ncbi:hypothetical protein FRB90_007261 [Tulasnella sp. 427]|nr:hypothetical protein FRB90_007261 [Tulasnella sp. 427]
MAGRPGGNFTYDPTTWAAILFAVIYGIVWATHTAQAIKYRALFMWVMFVACALEFIGFVTREIAIKQMYTLWPIVVSQTGLIVAPAFLAAQDYMIIGRVMSFVGKEYGYIDHNKITKIFVGADIFAILTQGGGGAMLFAEIKFTPGNDDADGYLLNHEWPMYVFDSIPVLISIIFFCIWHPGAYLPSRKGLRIDGTYEEQRGRRKFLCCGPRKPAKNVEMSTADNSAIALEKA